MDQIEEIWLRPNWDADIEKIFVESLIEEMKMVDRLPSAFRVASWNRVLKNFNFSSQMKYDKKELQKQLRILRKRFQIARKLGIHISRRKVNVQDDNSWYHYVQSHPEVEPFETWGCPLYDDLCKIFQRRAAAALSRRPVRRKKTGAAATSQGRSAASSPETAGVGPEKIDDSLVSCLRIMMKMNGVTERLYALAEEDLFDNQIWRKIFVSLKEEKRLKWLKAMLPQTAPAYKRRVRKALLKINSYFV